MKTFSEYFEATIRSAFLPSRPLEQGECQSHTSERCKLCFAINLTYSDEVILKNKALLEFWKQLSRTPLAPLVDSPRGRAYRTVTKRKVFPFRDTLKLCLIDPSEGGSRAGFNVIRCAIEPDDHGRIYAKTQDLIAKPYATSLADQLSYVIIKGNYTEYTVIFNVLEISPSLIKAANTLSKSLTHELKDIIGLLIYEDDSGRGYYMGAKSAHVSPKIKKIFGKSELYQKVLTKSFLYSPLSFSQVNQSIIESLILNAGELLELKKDQTMFDLYCGYGLFSLCLADKVRNVVGVELSPNSIESAIANAKRQGVRNARFTRNDITATSIQSIMKQATPNDVVLLDPPRAGTAEGVIECIAAKHPEKVLHIFCNIDLMPVEIARWEASGYKLEKVLPFDMFPGTSSIEMMTLFVRK